MIRTVSIIGAGNVAWHLSHQLKFKGIEVVQVFNRDRVKGESLAQELGCWYVSNVKDLADSDLYILAVKDSAISEILATNFFLPKNVLHVAGCVDVSVFEGKAKNFGVLYPVQSFSKEKQIEWGRVPFFVEGNTKDFSEEIFELAKLLSQNVSFASSAQRKVIHLAAVFACNFSNYFYSVAEDLLRENNLELTILEELIQETASKIKTVRPAQAQTGPARRNDTKTMEEHEKLLENKPEYLNLYKLITESIKNKYEIH